MSKCTVAIPVFNREEFIGGCLKSVIDQSVEGLEIIVADNASTDRTCNVVEEMAIPGLQLVRNERNLGLFGNFRRCLQLAGGEYLCLLCSDDYLVSGFLAAGIAYLDANPAVAIFTGRGQIVDGYGRIVGTLGHYFAPGRYDGRWAIKEILRFHARHGIYPLNYMDGMLLRTSLAKRTNGFDATYFGAADLEFTYDLLRNGDLFIADRETLRVTFHDKQEGRKDEISMRHIPEMLRLSENQRELLEADGTFAQIRKDLAGVGLGFAIQALLKGRVSTARAHFDASRKLEPNLLSRMTSLICVAARRFGPAARGVPLVFPPLTHYEE